MKDIIEKLEHSQELIDLSKDEIIRILSDESFNDVLFEAADKIRAKYVGDEIHLRGLIEMSNICKQNCQYCGLRKDNTTIERYRLEIDKIVELAAEAVKHGYKTLVLQSGEDSFYNIEKMKELISRLKQLDVALTLSLGEKTLEEYQAYKEAGADRYLVRIETTDRELYKKMHPDMNFDSRLKCLDDLRELGFEVGTGGLVGLPEQTVESLADDILFFKKINADMVGIGPFIPNPDTPLSNAEGGSLTQSLKVMALTRILLPNANIPATTAMEALHPHGRIIALQSGANVVMPNITDECYREKYLLYPGKVALGQSLTETRAAVEAKIKSIGRNISTDYGFRRK